MFLIKYFLHTQVAQDATDGTNLYDTRLANVDNIYIDPEAGLFHQYLHPFVHVCLNPKPLHYLNPKPLHYLNPKPLHYLNPKP